MGVGGHALELAPLVSLGSASPAIDSSGSLHVVTREPTLIRTSNLAKSKKSDTDR